LAVWRQTSKLSPDEMIYQVSRLIDAVCDDDLSESVWHEVFIRYLDDLLERCAALEGETDE
jgi:hypothetical protein